MSNFFSKMLIKLLGNKWILSAVSTLVAFVMGYLKALPVDLSPDDWQALGELLKKILTGLANWGLVAVVGYDYVASKVIKKAEENPNLKPETPKIVKE